MTYLPSSPTLKRKLRSASHVFERFVDSVTRSEQFLKKTSSSKLVGPLSYSDARWDVKLLLKECVSKKKSVPSYYNSVCLTTKKWRPSVWRIQVSLRCSSSPCYDRCAALRDGVMCVSLAVYSEWREKEVLVKTIVCCWFLFIIWFHDSLLLTFLFFYYYLSVSMKIEFIVKEGLSYVAKVMIRLLVQVRFHSYLIMFV